MKAVYGTTEIDVLNLSNDEMQKIIKLDDPSVWDELRLYIEQHKQDVHIALDPFMREIYDENVLLAADTPEELDSILELRNDEI